MIAEAEHQWAESPLPKTTVAAALVVGTMGVMIAGVQPMLFGALLSVGRISAAQIGHAASAELIAIGIGVVIAAGALEKMSVWVTSAAALLLMAVLNIVTTYTHGIELIIVRALVGIPEGVLLWMASAVIVRSARPTSLSAAFLLTQAVLQFTLSTGLAIASSENPDAVPFALAALSAVSLLFVPLLPRMFKPLPKASTTVSGMPPIRGWVVLVITLLIQGCIVGAWVYMAPLGKQAGMTPTLVAYAVPASLGAQVLGGTLAIILAKRIQWLTALVTSSVVLSGVLVILSLPPAPSVFFVLEVSFGALWIFITPYLTPLSIEYDSTRRTALLVPSAVLIGSGIGPLAASIFATEQDASGVLRLCAVLAVAAVALIFALNISRSSSGDVAFHGR